MAAGLLALVLIPNSYPPYPAAQLSRAPVPSQARALPWLHSDGHAIVDSLGRQVLLRGMDVTGLEQAKDMRPGPPPTARDFQEMSADGFDVIRLPVSWSRLEPQPGRISATYLNQIAAVVRMAARQRIYTIIELHNIDWGIFYGGDGAPSWASAGALPRSFPVASPWNRHLAPGVLASYGIFWTNLGGWQRDVTQVWSALAKRFRDDSAVAGFDLWNEPHPFPIPPGLFEKKYLYPFEAQLITHLARIAPRQIWITEQTLSFGLPTYVARLPYPNQVYSSHVFATLLEPPWQKPTPEYRVPLTLLLAQAKTAGAAPWVGEVGAGPGATNQEWVVREMNELDHFRLGWAYWDWDEGGSWAFKRMKSRLRVVARAYPRATPGQLQRLSYDYRSGLLQLSVRGNLAKTPLLIEVPSFFRRFQLRASDPAQDLVAHLDPTNHLLTVRITNGRLSHRLSIRFLP
ncbi:MAG: cellulase family glycosylhydrolase [Candidatus Dormibacteria bacterium]